jgi:hypothetical protein
LIFHDQTGKQVDFDLRGSIREVLERVAPKPVRTGPGRPRLGVTSREVYCCHGIGSGWRSSRTGRRRHCAVWWMKRESEIPVARQIALQFKPLAA